MEEKVDYAFENSSGSGSIAAIFKKRAVVIDDDITPEDHHSMACGLSSILNLGCQSQKAIYSPIEWQNLQGFFTEKYNVDKISNNTRL
jgi:hypothetical protein